MYKVGKYKEEYNEILDIKINAKDIYSSAGLRKHMEKRKHHNCIKYLDCLPDIIKNPDYIGVNPNESGITIKLVKKYEDNVLVGIKLDKKEDFLYVATMYEIQESKVERRLYSGRLKQV